jgi:membrane protein
VSGKLTPLRGGGKRSAVPPPLRAAWLLTRDTVTAWSEDYASSMGAALAYYTVFSIAPLLLIVIAVAGYVFGTEAAHGEILEQLDALMGAEGARAAEALLNSVRRPETSLVATVTGTVILLVGATSVFVELQNALDRIWRVPARERAAGWFELLRTRLMSFGMILGIAFLLMVSLLVSAALAALEHRWRPLPDGWETVTRMGYVVFSFALITVLFALIYKFIPRARIRWRDVWIGAAATALLFTVGKFLIGLYIGKSAVTSGFGAAGSLAALLLWVYYSAQIFLLGAEFTWVYAHAYGSRRGQHRPRPEDGPGLPQRPAK